MCKKCNVSKIMWLEQWSWSIEQGVKLVQLNKYLMVARMKVWVRQSKQANKQDWAGKSKGHRSEGQNWGCETELLEWSSNGSQYMSCEVNNRQHSWVSTVFEHGCISMWMSQLMKSLLNMRPSSLVLLVAWLVPSPLSLGQTSFKHLQPSCCCRQDYGLLQSPPPEGIFDIDIRVWLD